MGQAIFSIVVPVYQNAANLPDTVPRLLTLQDRLLDFDLEIVFVDDGSADGSLQALHRFQRENPSVITIVKLTRNFGQLAAINVGLSTARGACVGIISADLQDPCELFVDLIDAWRKGAKLVIAERAVRYGNPVSNFFSNMFWWLVSKLAVPGFPPGGFDFCLLDRTLVEDAVRCSQAHINPFVTLAYFGYPEHRIPYTRQNRTKGRSQWTLFKKVDLMLGTLFSFTSVPIKSFIYLGFFISFLSMIYMVYVVFGVFIYGTPVAGWPTLAVLITFFGGISILFLGIIGEYVWQIVVQTRRRPEAVVDYVKEREVEEIRKGADSMLS